MTKDERGVGLIEVLIALAILGLVAAAFLSGLATASKAVFIADERTTAKSLARSQMEYAKNQPYEYAPDDGQVTYDKITGIPDGYTIWSENRAGVALENTIYVYGVPWDNDEDEAATTDAGLQRIKLVIKHHGKEIITLEDYKVDR